MDWKTFCVEMVNTLAWPILACLALFMFRKQIAQILDEIADLSFRLKRGDNEVEISAKTRQVKEQTKEILLEEPEEQKLLAESKVLTNPKQAIENAWSHLNSTIKETIGTDFNQSFEIEPILRSEYNLPKDKFRIFADLKDIRNASTDSPVVISSGTALDYSEAAYKLSKYLREHKK
ncbi:MAG: hypothetical protein ABIK15_11870 [Pseudomonadota bacterium]